MIQHDMQHQAHGIFWWNAKVLCGIVLIIHFVVGMLFDYPNALIDFPLLIGQALALAGGLMFIYHFVLLKKHNNNIGKPSILLSNKGLFRWIRHPMYFADFVINAGFMLLHFSAASIIVYAIACYSLCRQAKIEDNYLASLFGEAHGAWRKRSWMLVPFAY
jgi:protein-S-isoprenylcysteine O-methyltransferase Ste14